MNETLGVPGLLERNIYCPYCGEQIQVLIDASDAEQEYIEDCQVCCRPITFVVTRGSGGGFGGDLLEGNEDDLTVSVRDENDI